MIIVIFMMVVSSNRGTRVPPNGMIQNGKAH